MKWVTRSHVHVDRVACPWMILRFIDANAEFIFVPKSQVLETARREQAISFDSPGAQYDHDGDLCTFDVLIRHYGLVDPALLRLAKVVNAADTRRYDRDPLAHGLEAMAVGFGLRYPNDQENLVQQFQLYDALLAWCAVAVARGDS